MRNSLVLIIASLLPGDFSVVAPRSARRAEAQRRRAGALAMQGTATERRGYTRALYGIIPPGAGGQEKHVDRFVISLLNI